MVIARTAQFREARRPIRQRSRLSTQRLVVPDGSGPAGAAGHGGYAWRFSGKVLSISPRRLSSNSSGSACSLRATRHHAGGVRAADLKPAIACCSIPSCRSHLVVSMASAGSRRASRPDNQWVNAASPRGARLLRGWRRPRRRHWWSVSGGRVSVGGGTALSGLTGSGGGGGFRRAWREPAWRLRAGSAQRRPLARAHCAWPE